MLFAWRRIIGDSMLPTLRPGAVVFVVGSKVVRVGDVVLLTHQGMDKIKRVAAIGEQGVFVLGDNSAQSTDSRTFGWLPLTVVRGKVILPRTTVLKRNVV